MASSSSDASAPQAGSLEITQVRSLVGARQGQRRTLRALGLRRVNHTVKQPDRPEIRGMVAKVAHLVQVRDAAEETPPRGRERGSAEGETL